MKDKVNVWVVVRFDESAPEQDDAVAIKAVYDSQEEATAAAGHAAKESAHGARYRVVRSRRLLRESTNRETHKGNQERLERSLGSWQDASKLLPELTTHALRELAAQLPSELWKRTRQPLLSHYAEVLVARALKGSLITEHSSDGDVRLADGGIVEVKAVLLDSNRPKAPFVQFRSDRAQYLAVVLFSTDLTSVVARLIPLSVLTHFDRPGPHSRHGRFSTVRITPDLMNAPGTSEINLQGVATTAPNEHDLTEEIRNAVHGAAERKQKIAMFHLQILRHATALEGVNPKAFCHELRVPETYATEFTKMIGLARLMKAQGLRIV